MSAGVTGAEATVSEGDEFSATVRMREVESLKEAGSRSAGLRILMGRRAGSAYTSDLSPAGIRRMVASAVELAAITTEDPHAGLPKPAELGSLPGDLSLYCGDITRLEAARKIEMAREAEAAALDYDSRIANSEGASFDSHAGRRAFANSLGFAGEYRSSYCSLHAVPVARQGDSMERDYWFSMARSLAGLEKPAHIGRTAAQRALRRLANLRRSVRVRREKKQIRRAPRRNVLGREQIEQRPFRGSGLRLR